MSISLEQLMELQREAARAPILEEKLARVGFDSTTCVARAIAEYEAKLAAAKAHPVTVPSPCTDAPRSAAPLPAPLAPPALARHGRRTPWRIYRH